MSMRNSGSVRSVRETGTGGKVRPVVSREGADGFFRTVPAVGEGPSCRLLRTVAKLRENAYLPVGMTTLGYLSEIFRLFYPERCAACGCALPEGAVFLCPRCRWDMPLTGYAREHDNPVARKFWGLLPVREACAMMFFVRSSPYRSMIHDFKYRGQWRTCSYLGGMLGAELRDGGLYADVDTVVPVPLHGRRRFVRGYNQAEYLAEGIAGALHAEVDGRSVVRSTYNRSQTAAQARDERWENVRGIFSVRRPERLAGRHVLLVDDVLTTGATLVACGETILRAVPDCRISIAALAVSAYELFGGRGKGGL